MLSFQKRIEVTAPRAPRQFHGDFQFRFLDCGEIDEFAELFKIIRSRVNGFAFESSNDRALERPIFRLQPRDVRFNLLRHIGCGRRAVAGGEFQALILCRVVAGSHVDAAECLAGANGVRYDGRRRVALAEERSQAAARENFRGGEGKFAAEKARVVSENDQFRVQGFGLRVQVIRDALGGEPDVIEGEILRHDAAPAGGAEFNRCHNVKREARNVKRKT